MIFHGNFPEVSVSRLFAVTLIDFLAFPFFLVFGHFKFVFNSHGGINHAVSFKGNLVTNVDFGSIGSSRIQHNGNRPECTVSQQEISANAFPIRFGHETVQGRKTTDTEHDQIAFNLGRNFNFLQASSFFNFCFKFSAFEFTNNQTFSTMGCN